MPVRDALRSVPPLDAERLGGVPTLRVGTRKSERTNPGITPRTGVLSLARAARGLFSRSHAPRGNAGSGRSAFRATTRRGA
jgi:hypothetical protein